MASQDDRVEMSSTARDDPVARLLIQRAWLQLIDASKETDDAEKGSPTKDDRGRQD